MTTNPRQQQAVLQAVLESPKDIVIFALDRNYRYLAFNENHARTINAIWGATLHIGDNLLEIIGRDDDRERAREHFNRALAGESFTVIEQYGDEKLTRRFYEDVYSPIRDENGEIIGLTLYLTDITERLNAEEELERYRTQLEELVQERTMQLEAAHAQLLHMQKLESLGLLAGGIAHDFNNLLAVILGRTELARARTADDHPAAPHLDMVQETALEARMLTRQLLGYAGRGKFLVQVALLNDLVISVQQLLRASVRKSISLSFVFAPEGLNVEVDVTQIRQVLLNLVVNAAEAIGERPGHITVRTKAVVTCEDMLKRGVIQGTMLPGGAACIEVEDDGPGMDEHVRERLFDPFFTTKFSGRGLGLAAVFGIVSGHRGNILVRSEVGQGTCFSVLLPVTEREVEPVQAPGVHVTTDFRSRSASVLIVDDEPGVRTVTAEVLRTAGFRAYTAEGGLEACDIYSAHPEISVVLLDLTMPELSGEETLQRLAQIRSDVRVVVMTGYTKDEVHLRFVRGQVAGFLAKPFVRSELISAIRQALEGGVVTEPEQRSA